MENDYANENEKLSFVSLAALTANVLRYLEPDKQKQEQAPGDRNASDADKKREEDQRDYVEHRLREISAWERRINGGKKV